MWQDSDWFKRLAARDQQDVSHVVQVIHNWTQGNLAPSGGECDSSAGMVAREVARDVEYLRTHTLVHWYFFAMYAFGSTTTGAAEPHDIDLLLVTNLFPSEVYGVQPRFSDLVSELGKTHAVTIDRAIEDRYSDAGTEARLKLDLEPQNPGAKPIDVVYQWDILSPRHWEAHDPIAVPIWKVGAEEPGGYQRRLSRVLPSEIPLEKFRLSDIWGY